MNNGNKLTSRKIRALETKQNLFKSALKLFSERGYDTVSVEDITTEAGTSKGSFYTYFENKEHVLVEQFKQVDDYYLKVYKNLRKKKNAPEKLMAFVKKQQQYVVKEMGIANVKILYSNQIRNKIENTFIVGKDRPVYRIIQEIIEEGQKEGNFRKDIPAVELVKLVIRCMRGSLYEWCLNDGNYSLTKDGEWFFNIVINDMLKPKYEYSSRSPAGSE